MAVVGVVSLNLLGPGIPSSRRSGSTQLGLNTCLGRPFSFSSASGLLKMEPCFGYGGEKQEGSRGRSHGKLQAALSQSVDSYRRVGAPNSENVDVSKLVQCLEEASVKGREVIMEAVDKPRSIDYKGATDLVTDTDRKSEEAILEVVRKYFPDHLILGEEGGVSGDPSSEYLWCVDPLDGTTNFAQNYPCFAVSIAVLFKGRPLAASVVEFAGGPFIWDTRTFIASSGGGAFCNGRKISCSQRDQVERSLFVTGFGYEHDEAWATNIELFKEFTDKSRGVRRLGAAAVDMCHVALGIAEAYWEYRLKPWDMAAGVLIVEEAGGKVTCMDGSDFSVFERSVLVSNGILHDKLLERMAPPTKKLIQDGFDFSQWYKPKGYISEV
ncbi:unnamed protein product [Calypogeia fissa]